MHRLRNKLVLVFLAATLVPLLATLWMTTSLLQMSLSYTPTQELDDLSKSLESTGQKFYQNEREDLRAAAEKGTLAPRYLTAAEAPEFWESGEQEQFSLAGPKKDTLELMVREPNRVALYSEPLGVEMGELTQRIARAREIIAQHKERDMRRGFTYTYVLLTLGIWFASMLGLVYLANRISRPIQQVTAGPDGTGARAIFRTV